MEALPMWFGMQHVRIPYLSPAEALSKQTLSLRFEPPPKFQRITREAHYGVLSSYKGRPTPERHQTHPTAFYLG